MSTVKRFCWVFIPLAVFIVGQFVSLALLAHERPRQEAIPAQDGFQYFVQAHEANPSWSDYVAGWNGQGYREIATNGYPTVPPRTDTGATLPNVWAFFPLYPTLVKTVMMAGMSFAAAAVTVSLLCGAAAIVLLFGLVRRHVGNLWAPSLAAASLSLWPTAPLFQLAYPEALALLLLIGMLWAITARRYWAAAALIMLLGLTRPVGPPDFVLVVLHGLYVSRHSWRPLSKLPQALPQALRSREAWAHIVLMGVSGFSAIVWPLISRVVTGENAFFNARGAYSSESFFGQWIRYALRVDDAYPLAPLTVAAFFALWACLQLRNRQLPDTLRAWPLILFAYIMMVTSPAGNEERYLMLGFFIYPWLTIPENRCLRLLYWACLAVALAIALTAQWSWVHTHWVAATGELRKTV